MIIDKDLIKEAKRKLGDKAAFIIAAELELKEFDDKNLKAICKWHEEDTPSLIWNPKEDSYKCFGCGKVYGIIDHYMAHDKLTFLGAAQKLFQKVDIKHAFGNIGIKQREYKYPRYLEDNNRILAEKYLATRGISPETLDYFDVKQYKGNVVFNFYDTNDVLTTVKLRPSRKLQKGEHPKMWFLPNYDNKPILYGMNKIDPTKPLIICEGEIETLTAYEAGYSNVVSIPGGTENKKWIDECWDWLEQFDKIILAYDNDDAGIKARKDVASRLGIWRTQYIIIEDKFVQEDGETPCKDLNEVLINYGKDAVMSLIESAQDIPVEGVNNLSTVGVFDIEKAEGLYTSLKPLDDIVYKFLMGSVVVFTGKRSSGKSSFINQTFANGGLNQGYDIFYYSGELDPRVLKSWLDVNLAGEEHIRSEQGGFVRIIDKTALQEINKWYNGRVWVYDNHSHKATDIINTAQATTRRYGTKIWIIDNLMMLDLESDGDMSSVLQKQKEFISNLVRLAQLYNVLVVLAIHPRKGMAGQNELTADDVSGSGDLTNMSQYVISAHRYTDREKEGEMNNRGEYKKGKEPIEHDVCIEVLKNRFTGKNGKADLYFNYADYRFYSNEDELYRRYKWNKSTEPVKKKKRENEASAFFIE